MNELIIKETTALGKIALHKPGELNCFMGVSIRNRFFSANIMQSYFLWFSKQFKQCIILMIDDPDHYNYIGFSNDGKKKALEKSRKMGEEKKLNYNRIVTGMNIDNISFITFRDFVHDEHYQKLLKKIHQYESKNFVFKKSLYSVMEQGIGGKIKEFAQKHNLKQDQIMEKKSILFNYIIEEYASLLFLTEKGYTIEVDPYREFITKKLIYEGYFPDLYKDLKLTNRGHIIIYPKGM